MAGGGSAPAMKLSDVFILVGASILIGSFFMHAWSSGPVQLDSTEEDENMSWYTNGASLLKGDTIAFDIESFNTSDFEVKISDDTDDVVFEYSNLLADGDSQELSFQANEGGFYTYNVTFSEGQGSVLVDVDRKLLIDFIFYPVGLSLLIFGLIKRKESLGNEVLDAELEPNELD